MCLNTPTCFSEYRRPQEDINTKDYRIRTSNLHINIKINIIEHKYKNMDMVGKVMQIYC